MGKAPQQPSMPVYTPPAASPSQIQQGIDPVTGMKIKKARKGASSQKTVLTSSSGAAGQADTAKKTVLGG
jgi:hypothetical protein